MFTFCPRVSFSNTLKNDYVIDRWTTEEGLSHNTITDIRQSHDGYIWLSSWEGITRFDGSDFKNSKEIHGALFDDVGVWELASSSKGSIFIGGAQGQLVVRNDIGNWKLLANFDSQINAILYHPRYNLLVGTEDGSLFAVASTGEVLSLLSTISSITSLVNYRDNVLIGTLNGLIVLNENTLSTENYLENYRINSIVTHGQAIVIATDRGVARYETTFEADVSWIIQGVDSLELMYDSQDRLWIGTTKEGVYVKGALGQLTNMNTQSGLTNNRVLTLFEDKDFNIWVGTNGGVARFRKVPFNTLSIEEGLSSKFVRAAYQSKNSKIWIATSEGLDLVDYSTRKVSASFLPEQYVLSLGEDMNNNILVGTYTDGVFIQNGDTFIPFQNTEKGLPSNEVRAIAVDLNNTIWIGTADGLVKVNKDESLLYQRMNGVKSDFITAISLINGYVWVGTSQGFYKIGLDGIAIPFSEPNFVANHVFSFLHDEFTDDIWISTDAGLYRYRPRDDQLKRLENLPYKNTSKFFGGRIDTLGYIWLSSNQGVFRLHKSKLNAFIDGESGELPYDLFDNTDGMLTRQANGRSMPSTWLDRAGNFWVATANGVAIAQTNDFKSHQAKRVEVLIESIEIDQRFENLVDNLRLAPTVRHLRIRYSSINLISPERNNYRVKLEGYDNNWQYRGKTKFTEYSALPHGDYTFLVSAAITPYSWGEPTRLNINIEPYWWETFYARLGFVILLIATIYVIVRIRTSQAKKREVELGLIVDEKTVELENKSRALEKLTREDPLTGLLNRRAFTDIALQIFRQSKQSNDIFSIAFFDIDHFKMINDNWSHKLGDEALRQVSAIIKNNLRDMDTVARWGGEEFIIILPSADIEAATEVCERVREAVESFDGNSLAEGVKITISGGISISEYFTSVEDIIHNADIALYRAKENGRNRIEVAQGL